MYKRQSALQDFLAEEYGAQAGVVDQAQRAFSEAFRQFPFDVGVLYKACLLYTSRLEAALYNIDGRIERTQDNLAKLRLDHAEAQKIVAEPFPQQEELDTKMCIRDRHMTARGSGRELLPAIERAFGVQALVLRDHRGKERFLFETPGQQDG